jgi:putative transposase
MPMTRQCQLLGLSRSSVYYRPVPVSEEDLAIMRRLDELHLCYPFFGVRKLTAMLNREGRAVGRKRVRRLMRRMGIFALYRRPRTTVPAEGHRVFPYLLTGLEIARPNQVGRPISLPPMTGAFTVRSSCLPGGYGWRLSNTLRGLLCTVLRSWRGARRSSIRPG